MTDRQETEDEELRTGWELIHEGLRLNDADARFRARVAKLEEDSIVANGRCHVGSRSYDFHLREELSDTDLKDLLNRYLGEHSSKDYFDRGQWRAIFKYGIDSGKKFDVNVYKGVK